MLDYAEVPRSSYYAILKQLSKADKYATIKAKIIEINSENKGRYGYRRMTNELKSAGFTINHKTVLKLTRELGLLSKVRMKKYVSYRGDVGKIAPNLLERDFTATQPNQKWVTDVTEFSLFGSKLYLSPILDLFNGEIISYTISDRPNFQSIMTMLKEAFKCLPKASQPILHSDQGWQYQMKQFQFMLKDNGLQQSMSRKGNCLDNAAMESFFGHLKSELLYLQKFESVEHFKKELIAYLHYYNHKRIKLKLKGLSPVQYRIQSMSYA